ncbi:MAG: hypothetical protein IKT40_03360 [Bacilli bacterium]|nr:hypothetical protein [Bacilli bacterium]
MTKTIEFVEEEIKFCQLKINKAKEEKIYQETMVLLLPENKNINLEVVNEIEISYNEYKIKQLEQIKCELEAWEVVKRELVLTVKEDKQKYDFAYYWLIYHPYELLEIEKQDYEIIKKALEAE